MSRYPKKPEQFETDKPPIRLLLTPLEAAKALSINRSTLYILMARNEIPSVKIGASRRIKVKDLEDWIDNLAA